MARKKSDMDRVQISTTIKDYLLKYTKARAALKNVGANVLIESALVEFLEFTQVLKRNDIFELVSPRAKAKRVPLTTWIDAKVLGDVRELAERAGVNINHVIEKALVRYYRADFAGMIDGNAKPKATSEDVISRFSEAEDLVKEILDDIINDIEKGQK